MGEGAKPLEHERVLALHDEGCAHQTPPPVPINGRVTED